MRNQGETARSVAQAQQLHQLVIDGQSYCWIGEIRVKSSAFPPGREYRNIPVTLSENWQRITETPDPTVTSDPYGPGGGDAPAGNRPLKLKPGKHTIRLVVLARATTKGPRDVRAESNPLEIEIIE